MKIRAVVLIVLLVAAGVATLFRNQVTGYERPDEAWLESVLPDRIGDSMFLASASNPKQSYAMDRSTYEALKPIGIVARVYQQGPHRYDVVVIAGDEPNTFHDQTWCFKMQNWQILEDRTVSQPTRTVGEVPMRLIHVANDQTNQWMVFVFRGPAGNFYPDFGGMWREFFFSDLKRGVPTPTSFLRVIGLTGQTPEQVLSFAARAIDSGAMPYGPPKER
ncbi:MAG: hypothetical protein N2109_07460 [Fimbriimonadales bacterium]|nr:hypothetical protein [Fimbriimonadales bacterium]